MKINAIDVRIGNVIEHQSNLWLVLKREHTMPGKGGAYIQVELKDIVNGTKSNVRFRSAENIERAFLEQRKMQFQYLDRDEIVAMDMESYEQFHFSKKLAGDSAPFLKEEMVLSIEYCNDKAIFINLPETVTLEVTQADAVIKGQTVSSSYKPAILENGVRVMVPPFVGTGDKIIVKCQDGSYVERAKK